ncbi:nuclear pore complex protein [Seminavis robusta]|uniref:Nuclear pore protein n=1 Tax=Seminavis robusta TaxID=568900 RepID=A0A9N8DZU5_9STRA|nr:nuclear pore complex protein [Seminavis robusta]|eukprot:Sro397_g134470.1 nuclear pore complex protein (811) ;mRNA; r:33008-35609
MPREGLDQLALPGANGSNGSSGAMFWDKSLSAFNANADGLSFDHDFGGGFPGLTSRRDQDLGGSVEAFPNQPMKQAETEFLQWDKSSQQRELDLLKSLVRKSEMKVQKRSRELYDTADERDWVEKHDSSLKEIVGTRNLGGSAADIENTMLLSNTSDGRTAIPQITAGQYPQPSSSSNANSNSRPCDPQIVRYHFEVVKNQKNKETFADAASDLAKKSESSGVFPYSTALKLISSMISRPNFSREEVALASISHFSAQFDAWMTGRVRQGTTVSASAYNSPRANTVASFISSELGAGAETSIWPCLYLCLRVGDAVAAKEFFDRTATPNESNETRIAIGNILAALCQRQGTLPSLWDARGPLTLPAHDRRAIADASEVSTPTDNRFEVYRTGFLTLLGCSGEFPSSRLAGFSTIEDYLFGMLNSALHHPSPEQLDRVGKQIVQFGPGYFGDQDSSGWSYCLPLLASQQFRTGLSHLSQVGGQTGRMQATHLGMFLLGSKGLLNILEESERRTTESFFISLLVGYATWLDGHQAYGAVCALEYLQNIPDENVKRNELVSLLVRTSQIEMLAGSITMQDGKRSRGALDAHFPTNEVSFLLKQAGEKCKDATDRPRRLHAVRLYMLAGEFRGLMEMMMRLMVSSSEVHDAENQYWCTESNGFCSNFLNQPSIAGNLDANVVATFSAMIEIANFKARIQAGAQREAWSAIDRLDLIPKSEADVSRIKETFNAMAPVLKEQVPWVLLGAMRSFCGEYHRLKNGLRPATESTTMEALRELKERARVVLISAGMISSNEVNARIQLDTMTQLEARMI